MPCLLDAHLPYSRRFRRLPSGRAPASQPSGQHLAQASNALRRFGSNCSALRASTHATTMASADFRRFIGPPYGEPSTRQTGRPLRVRRATFLPHTRRIYAESVRMASGFGSMRPLAHQDVASDAIRVTTARLFASGPSGFRLAADTLTVRLGVPAIKASTGTSTRQVASRVAFASRLAASGHDAARHACRPHERPHGLKPVALRLPAMFHSPVSKFEYITISSRWCENPFSH